MRYFTVICTLPLNRAVCFPFSTTTSSAVMTRPFVNSNVTPFMVMTFPSSDIDPPPDVRIVLSKMLPIVRLGSDACGVCAISVPVSATKASGSKKRAWRPPR